MHDQAQKRIAHHLRFVGRHVWAAALIPLGLGLGVGGWVQHALRVVTKTGAHADDN